MKEFKDFNLPEEDDFPEGLQSRQLELMKSFHRMRRVNINTILEITPGEFFVLQIVDKYKNLHPDRDGIYVSKIAGKAKMASSQVSRMLKGMEERCLIGRSVDAKDRRNTYVYLTQQGRVVCQKTKETMEAYTGRVLDAMGENRIQELIALCNELADVMEKELVEVKRKLNPKQ